MLTAGHAHRATPHFHLKDASAAVVFLLPTLLILGIFKVFPAFYSLFLSFFEWDGLAQARTAVGGENYGELFASAEFWNSLRVTLLYSGGVTSFALVAGLILAVLLNSSLRGQTSFRVIYFLPVITPTVASGVIWKYLFDPSQGVLNRFLEVVGIEGPAWLSSPEWALPAVVIVGIWKRIGFNLVIYLAALQAIPRTFYEVASLDGAGPITKFMRITVPLVAPSTFFVAVTSIIDSFQAFDLVYVMTGGGPLGSTDVIGYMLYRYGFRYYELGYASAIAYAMFILLFAATLIQYRFQRKE
jgi:multiple sugar transport system permease protein